jgi:hypothetical protein
VPSAITSAAIGGVGALGSGVIGGIMQGNAAGKAANTARAAAQRFYDIEDPNYEEMRLSLEELQSQGLLTPELEQAILQDPSLMTNISKDPRLAKAEMDALATLANISAEGGMDPQAMLAMRQAQQSGLAQARGSREANLQNAAARGALGSGLEFVSNQMADQNAANQAEMVGLQQASSANQRDLQALGDYANFANQLGQQDLSLQSAKAQAQDAVNKFNTTIRGDVQKRNVGAVNAASELNLAEKQRIADQNTLLRNQQQSYNKGLEQKKFDNAMEKARGASGLTGAQMSGIGGQGQAAADLWGGVGQTLSGLGTTFANYYTDKDKKKTGEL